MKDIIMAYDETSFVFKFILSLFLGEIQSLEES